MSLKRKEQLVVTICSDIITPQCLQPGTQLYMLIVNEKERQLCTCNIHIVRKWVVLLMPNDIHLSNVSWYEAVFCILLFTFIHFLNWFILNCKYFCRWYCPCYCFNYVLCLTYLYLTLFGDRVWNLLHMFTNYWIPLVALRLTYWHLHCFHLFLLAILLTFYSVEKFFLTINIQTAFSVLFWKICNIKV